MAAEPPSAFFAGDFGQKIDLTARIREILVNYPPGTTILKEFVQNADDAGAARIKFCVDERSFPVKSLAHQKLAEFQGPSLLVHNDGVFSDQDFESIQNIGDSRKKGQLAKTGRFGIGFNSCYHLTDLPTFLSRSSLVMFDPQAKFLPDVNPANPGKRIDILSPAVQQHYPDQLAPFKAFGVDYTGEYNATLFRLPLRTRQQAATSKLSQQVHSVQGLLDLLRCFVVDAQQSLLFLKNISSIEALHWREGKDQPETLWSCSLDNGSRQLAQQRSLIPLSVAKTQQAASEEQTLQYVQTESDYELHVSVHSGEDKTRVTNKWLVCTSCQGTAGRAGKMACDPSTFHMKLVPWAGVAALVQTSGDGCTTVKGRAFCFLPLPAETGLPVHVNGFFELSSNRRDIWRGDDMAGEGRIRAEWNKALLEDVVAPTYARLLLRLSKQARAASEMEWYYSFWPGEVVAEPWTSLVRQVYSEASGLQVLYSAVGGGRWVRPADAMYVGEDWEHWEEVQQVLLEGGRAMVEVPSRIRKALESFSLPLFGVSPTWIRQFLSELPQSTFVVRDRDRGKRLLQYCLSDMLLGCSAATRDGEKYAQLQRVPLVPMADGSWRAFNVPKEKAKLLVGTAEESKILHSLQPRIVDISLPADVIEHMKSEAMSTHTNVRVITPEMASKFLLLVLPDGWHEAFEVQWRAGQDGQPTEEWMKLFWKYAGESGKVEAFAGWPLLPTIEGTLCVLTPEGSKVIDGAGVFGEQLRGMLTRLGCRMLNGELIANREAAGGYVHKASLHGVLEGARWANGGSLERIRKRVEEASVEERRELRAFLMQRRWMTKEGCSPEVAGMVLALPIHEVHGSDVLRSVSKEVLPPSGAQRELLTEDYIRASAEDLEVYTFLGVGTASLSEWYANGVFTRLGTFQVPVVEETMLTMLGQLPQLCREDKRFWDRLGDLPFVTTGTGKLARPRELYDPSVQELQELLDGGEFYPSESFLRPELIATLVRLGLRTSLDREGVLAIALSVQAQASGDGDVVRKRATALLRFMDAHCAALFKENFSLSAASKMVGSGFKSLVSTLTTSTGSAGAASKQSGAAPGAMDVETFKQKLLTVAWVPVLTEPPIPQLPWTEGRWPVACPMDVRPKEDLWVISFFAGIADCEVSSPELRKLFGWDKTADRSLIAAQLVKLSEMEGVGDNADLQESLNASVFRIYSAFQSVVSTPEIDSIRAILDGHKWVWMGDDFAHPDTVAFKCSLNARPMLSAVPGELLAFGKFLRAMGVRESFAGRDYLRSLETLSLLHGTTALPSDKLELAVAMVQYVADDRTGCDGMSIFVPDEEAVLQTAANLVYNDAPWIMASTFTEEDLRFVHPRISIDVGEKVGLRSLRRLLLLRTSDALDLGLQDAEAFGQSESLTGRLKHILELYPDGPGILNELIQNADDARASEVSIIINRTSYASSSLLSPKMEAWQGPAIYFHNNSVFSPHDFKNLTRIGQGSKLDFLGKTGKFGLGFNAVYHFTDLPSFVSGEFLVYFDPHNRFLPGATPQHPGLRIKFTRNNILSQFPDQFKPYLLLGCDLQSEYKGTLFRFPLRCADSASHSDIKKQPYSMNDVEELVANFRRLGPDALLFLKHIRSIKVLEISDADSEPKTLYHVSAQADPPEDAQRFLSLPSFVEGKSNAPITKEQFFKQLQTTDAKVLPRTDMTVDIVKTEDNGAVVTEKWAISSTIGAGKARQIAVHQATAHLRLVPWAGVAALVQTNVDAAEVIKGRAFCFLPLPTETGLPVHVNGYFELSSNRRDIWRGDDMAGEGRIRAEWNKALLEDVVAPTYARLLLRLSKQARAASEMEWYYSFWPGEVVAEPWTSLVRQVYSEASGLQVLYSAVGGGRWVRPADAMYVGEDWEHWEEVQQVLLEDGQAVVQVPPRLQSGFKSVQGSLIPCTPAVMRQLLASKGVCPLITSDRQRGKRLLQYCLSDMILGCPADTDGGEAYSKLSGVPLVPMADGSWQKFAKDEEQKQLLVGTEQEVQLLSAIRSRIVDSSLPADVVEHMKSEAMTTYTNVTQLSPELVGKCLTLVMPDGWHEAFEVQWRAGQDGQPTEEWMKLFWKYAGESGKVEAFAGWPLLPTIEGTLCVLTPEGSKVIDGAGVFGEQLRGMLTRLGCRMLNGELIANREAAGGYVHKASLHGVLEGARWANGGSLERIRKRVEEASVEERRELRAFLMQRRWMTKEGCSQEDAGMVLALPIHEVHGSDVLRSVSKEVLPPSGAQRELLTDQYIRASDAEMYTFLGVGTASLSEWYADGVFSHLDKIAVPAREEAMLTMLGQLPQLCREDKRFWDRLGDLPFVTTGTGKLARPRELYDPSVQELQELLDGGEFYPSESFLRPELIATLVRLGLRTSLDREGILQVARSISESSRNEPVDAGALEARGCSLLRFLVNQERGILRRIVESDSFTEFREELCSCAWIPVMVQPPREGLPWNPGRSAVARPKASRPKEDIMLASHSLGICCEEVPSSLLRMVFGWDEPVPPVVAALQLAQYAEMYGETLSVHPMEQSTERKTVPEDIRAAVLQLYECLESQVHRPEFESARSTLRDKRCVLVGESFVAAECVACECEVQAEPLLFALPENLAKHATLLSDLGVRDKFKGEDYVGALWRLKRECEDAELEEEQVQLATTLAKQAAQYKLEGEARNMLYLPDAAGKMVRVDKLVYDDAPWLSSTLNNVPFLHASITNDAAQALGLKSVRKLLLAGKLHLKDLACPSPEWLSQELPKGGGPLRLLPQLVECADVLGARAVHLLLDFRMHPAESILQPNLAALQGPAVVVYMEGVTLKPEQLCRLQNLAPHKQGLRRSCRSGPGLVCMYQAAEVASIVSGEGLYIFDPMGRHFVDQHQQDPVPVGKVHLFVNSDMPQRFPDQFVPFQIFGFDAKQGFNGTIIRLPVNTSGLDKPAGSPGTMVVADMEELERRCEEIVKGDCLLFLEDLESVAVSSWRKGQEDMKLVFKAGLQPPVSPALRQARGAMSRNREWQKFSLMSVFGSAPPIRAQVDMSIVSFNAASGQSKVDRWRVYHTLGPRQARKFALDHKVRGWIPLASVAALMGSVTGGSGAAERSGLAAVEGQVCSSMPLGPSGLPVHINAWFEVGNGGQLIWPCTANPSPEAAPASPSAAEGGAFGAPGLEEELEWNRELMSCVVDGYLAMLADMPEALSKEHLGDMYKLWPNFENTAAPLRTVLLRPIFAKLTEMQLYLTNAGQLVKMQGGVFRPSAASERLWILFKDLFPLFAAPRSLAHDFRSAGVHDVPEITPERVRKKLRKDPKLIDNCAAAIARANPGDTDKIADEVVGLVGDALEFCLTDLSSHGTRSFRELHGTRLLPVASGHVFCFPFEALVATAAEQKLLPALRDSYVDLRCSERLSRWFHNPDFLGALSLRRFTPQVLAGNLHLVLPRHWKGQQFVAADCWDSAALPSMEWFPELWRFIGPENLHLVTAWPCLLLTNGALASGAALHQTLNLPHPLPDIPGADQGGGSNQFPVFNLPPAEGEEAGEAQAELGAVVRQLQSHPVLTGLQRLGCPVLHPAVGRIVSRPDAAEFPNTVAWVLAAAMARRREGEGAEALGLHAVECRAVFTFFAQSYAAGRLEEQALQTLRRVPVFETLNGQFVTPVGAEGEERFTCSPELQGAVPDSGLLVRSQPAFLRALGVQELDQTALFERFVLPSFAELAPAQRTEAVQQIRRDWETIQARPALVEKLRGAPLVNMHGHLMRADQLYDPQSKLLAQVFKGDPVFPVGEQASADWLRILRRLGLQASIDSDTFVSCARRVQRAYADALVGKGGRTPEEVCAVAAELTHHLVEHFAGLHSPALCDAVVGIAFVPVELPPVDGGDGASMKERQRKVELRRFCDTCTPSDWHLVWTEMPVLPERLVLNDMMRSQLKVSSPPPIDVVLRHLAKVSGDTLQRWPLSESVQTVYLKTFDFLWRSWKNMSPDQRDQLRGLAIVPVGSTLVRASRVFFKLAGDFQPFMFETPRCFGGHEELLKALGARETPTGDDLAHFLFELGTECDNQPLNPNELSGVVKVLEALAELWSGRGGRRLLVPNAGGVLVESSRCFRCEDRMLLERVDRDRVHLPHSSLAEQVCEAAGLEQLAAALEERLEGNPEDLMLCHSDVEGVLTRRLRSVELARAVTWMLDSRGGETLKESEVKGLLGKVEVQVARKLRSRLYLRGEVDVTAWDAREVVFMVEEAKGRILVSEEQSKAVGLEQALALAVNKLLGGRLGGSVLALAVALRVDAANMEKVLLQVGVRAQPQEQLRVRGQAGAELLDMDVERLSVQPQRRFLASEIVAWRDQAGVVRYGAVVEASQEASSTNESKAESSGLSRLLVRTGRGEVRTMLSSQVMVFKPTAELRSAGGAAGHRLGDRLEHDLAPQAAAPAAQNVPSGQSVADPLSPAEIAEAVNELLGRLKVPTSLDQTKLLEQVLGLQQECQGLKAQGKTARGQAERLQGRQDRLRELCTCPITKEVMTDPVLASDGHVYERSAIQRLVGHNSPLTRQQLGPNLTASHAHKTLCRLFGESQ